MIWLLHKSHDARLTVYTVLVDSITARIPSKTSMPKLPKRSQVMHRLNGQFSAPIKSALAPEYSGNGVASVMDAWANDADDSEASDNSESGRSVSTNSEADWREITPPLTWEECAAERRARHA